MLFFYYLGGPLYILDINPLSDVYVTGVYVYRLVLFHSVGFLFTKLSISSMACDQCVMVSSAIAPYHQVLVGNHKL